MKLLYVVPSLRFFSEGYRGRVMHALGICEGYSELGWDVTIVGGEGIDSFSNDIPSSVKIVTVKEPRGVFKTLIWDVSLLFTFRRLTLETEFDHVMFRYVVSSIFFNLGAFLLKKKNSKFILEVNSFAFHMFFQSSMFLNKIVSCFDILRTYLFDVIYVVSDKMANDDRIASIRDKVISIPNGATSKELTFGSSKSDIKRIVYLGTLMPYWDFKFACDFLIELLKCSPVEVHFFGDGPCKSYIKNRLKNKERCFFYGAFDRNDLCDLLYSNTDILFLPSKTEQDFILSGGLSTKLFDYLSYGLPIIAPQQGEVCSVLRDGFNCIEYSIQDFSAVEKVSKLIQSEDHLYNISVNSRSDFLAFYSWRSRMEKLIGQCNDKK